MKSLSQIEKIVADIVKSFDIEECSKLPIYQGNRPEGLKGGCIVVSVKSGSAGRYQDFVVDINIYMCDEYTDKGYISNRQLDAIESKFMDLFEHYDTDGYIIKYDESPKRIRISETREHMLNNRLLLTYQNF